MRAAISPLPQYAFMMEIVEVKFKLLHISKVKLKVKVKLSPCFN
jgi:hypothetical protein